MPNTNSVNYSREATKANYPSSTYIIYNIYPAPRLTTDEDVKVPQIHWIRVTSTFTVIVSLSAEYQITMKKTSTSLKEIAFIGGNIILSAEDYTSSQIKEIVFSGRTKGCNVIIKNANNFTTSQCKEIAFVNPGHVTFDFS